MQTCGDVTPQRCRATVLQAAVKAVNEARQAARTASGNLPATPVMPGDPPSSMGAAAAAASTPAAAPSASFGSGGPGGAISGPAPSNNTVDADSAARDPKPAAGAHPHSLCNLCCSQSAALLITFLD